MMTTSIATRSNSFKLSTRSNSFKLSNNDGHDSISSNTNPDLLQDYQNAIDCLKQCESIITGLQHQLTSKDTQIANLEEKIVHLSFELATSKAFEDEHRSKRRSSCCDDNHSPGDTDGNSSVVTVEFDRSDVSNRSCPDILLLDKEERRGRRSSMVRRATDTDATKHMKKERHGRLTGVRRATTDTTNDPTSSSSPAIRNQNHRRKTHDCSSAPRRPSLLFGSWGSTTASSTLDESTRFDAIDESARSCTMDESICSSRRATMDESNSSRSWFLFRGKSDVSDRTDETMEENTLDTYSADGVVSNALASSSTSTFCSSAQSIREEIECTMPSHSSRRPARARRFERASLKKSLPGVVFPKSFEEVEGLFLDE